MAVEKTKKAFRQLRLKIPFIPFSKNKKFKTEQRKEQENVQHAKQRHQNHQKQIGQAIFINEHTHVNGDRAAEYARQGKFAVKQFVGGVRFFFVF